MKKKEIINLAKSIGFKLDYDKSEGLEHNGSPSYNGKWMRFVSIDDELDEKDLRWIWYMDDSHKDNVARGEYIQKRLIKKRKVLNSLKY